MGLNHYKSLVEKALKEITPKEAHPSRLYDPMVYALELGGKRIRPLFVFLTYRLWQEDILTVLRPAISVELLHSFTLIHDDVMDQAPLRRGVASVHEKWDLNTAILSGDALLVKGYEMLSFTQSKSLGKVLKAFNKCALEVCEGQRLDLDFEKKEYVSKEDYLEMIRLKTGCLIGLCFELGTILGGAEPEMVQEMRLIGEEIGIIFQMNDDFLDLYGNHKNVGKQSGGDILSNKKTILSVEAWNHTSQEEKNLLIQWQEHPTNSAEERKAKIKGTYSLYERIGIPKLTKNLLKERNQKIMTKLKNLFPTSNQRTALLNFVLQLIERNK
ncbi:MAG: polyprenyl synthetase family protein [Cytophagales bacterium]|nr:polyprenyl synthetase family protein [Cytophagales bacterium]